MNRPDAKNAIGHTMAGELLDVISDFGERRGLGALVLTGAGDTAFCAGGDIKEMESMDYKAARAFAVQAVVRREAAAHAAPTSAGGRVARGK
ncbi:MAG: enoyl-CoA hydratase/isomerase family protein [Nitrososphaerota archaeon]|nr:enoyl-CoA hydratase/isomerase family protein [Nitrososphaerota archaeon]